MNIIIKKHFLLYNGYKLKCSIGKSGLTGITKERVIYQHQKELIN